MKLFGLGLGHIGYLGSAACLSPVQLYQLALDAGFPPGTTQDQGNAGTMAAIAMRESAGCPDAHNPGTAANPEDSWGLYQVNINANPLSSFGLSSPQQLTDPAINTAVAYQLWGGDDNNLDTAWYIRHTNGSYRAQYLANLVVVQAAVGAGANVPGLGNDIVPVDDGSGDISMGIVLGGLAVTLGLLFLIDRR